jgi:hypothetical protein
MCYSHTILGRKWEKSRPADEVTERPLLSHPAPTCQSECPKQPGRKIIYGDTAAGVIGGRPIQKIFRRAPNQE